MLWGFLGLSVVIAVAQSPLPEAVRRSTNFPAIPLNDPVCAPFMTNGLVVQPPGTQRMVRLLAKLHKELVENPQRSLFMNTEMANQLRGRVAAAVDPVEALNPRIQLAGQLLLAGRSAEALDQYDSVLKDAAQLGMQISPQKRGSLSIQRALCHLRMGEQDNCLTNHTAESCLLPIRGEGVHKNQRGSRGAIAVLTDHMKLYGPDLQARWLLNIAYMTLGEYPDKVPTEWLVPPSAFAADYDIRKFPNVAEAAGLDFENLGGGVIAEDFDGDGYLDLMISTWSLAGQVRYSHNNGDGTFTDRTSQAGLLGITGGLNIQQMDYNNDGFPDVFMLRGAWLGVAGHHPNSLLRNNGNGTFTDVTEEAGLLSLHPTQTATWFDFNGDGLLDVFIGNETTPGDPQACELYRNNGDGTFTECAKESGLEVNQFIKAVASGDYDNDGRPDLYLSNRGGHNFLFHNDGPGTAGGPAGSPWKFSNVSLKAGAPGADYNFPTWFFDYDNDGWLDILVAGYHIRNVGDVAADYLGLPTQAEKTHLYRNNHDGTFSDVSAEAGLSKVIHAMGSNFGDLDNDGWLDCYFGTGDPDFGTLIPNRMFRNDGGKRFQEVTTSGGFGNIQKGHAIAFADLDNDGDQDVYEVMGGAYSGDLYRNSLYLNPGHGNHWITIKVEGQRSNRAGFGARIRVVVDTGEGERSIYKTVGSGGSFGASPLRQEIGLGQAKAIKAVEIFWPATGQTQKLGPVDRDHFYQVRESDASLAVWNLKSFKMPTEGKPHQHPAMNQVGLK